MATTVTTVQAPPPVMIQHPQAVLPPQPPRNQSCVRGLAVTQVVIGVLTGVLGIAAVARLYENIWVTNTGAGIWAGGWIFITGIVGVASSRNHTNTGLNGVYMAFSIISTCASALAGLFFIVAVVFYAVTAHICYNDNYNPYYPYSNYNSYGYDNDCSYRDIGLGLYIPLLIMMIVEFFVSIIAAVYCCQNGCGRTQLGVIVQTQPQQVMMVTTTGTAGYPTNVVQYPQYGGQVVAQPYGGQGVPQYSGQPGVQYNAQVPPQYNNAVPVAYGAQPQYYPQGSNVQFQGNPQEKPPGYTPTPQ